MDSNQTKLNWIELKINQNQTNQKNQIQKYRIQPYPTKLNIKINKAISLNEMKSKSSQTKNIQFNSCMIPHRGRWCRSWRRRSHRFRRFYHGSGRFFHSQINRSRRRFKRSRWGVHKSRWRRRRRRSRSRSNGRSRNWGLDRNWRRRCDILSVRSYQFRSRNTSPVPFWNGRQESLDSLSLPAPSFLAGITAADGFRHRFRYCSSSPIRPLPDWTETDSYNRKRGPYWSIGCGSNSAGHPLTTPHPAASSCWILEQHKMKSSIFWRLKV